MAFKEDNLGLFFSHESKYFFHLAKYFTFKNNVNIFLKI